MSSTRRVAVVVKPILPGAPDAIVRARATCERLDMAPPTIYETTADSPGYRQATEAVEAGADVVVAVGGDGTTTQVAAALAGTDVALGVLPAGTANLFAVNAGLTALTPEVRAQVAVAGAPQPADLGLATLTTTDGPLEHSFLVVAGIGHDARTLRDVRQEAKSRAGAASYVLPGLRRLDAEPMDFRVSVQGEDPRQVRAWSLLVANNGRLPYGLRLVPDLRPNDGALSLVVVEPENLWQWSQIAATGVRPRYRPPTGLRYRRGEHVRIETPTPRDAQIDGDVIEGVTAIDARVRPGALYVNTVPSGQAVPRLHDLSEQAIARLVYDAHTGGMSAGGQAAVVALLRSLEGERFQRVKYLLNNAGDMHDLERIVYDELSESPRDRLLEHIAAQSQVTGAVDDIRVLCDIDDTVKCAIHDTRYPKGTVYPGVEAFLRALDQGAARDPGRPGDLTFVTARPGGPAGLFERYTLNKLDDLDLPPHTVMGGSLLNLHTKTAIAARKNENIARDRELFPECRMVFVGDSGQADAQVGLAARRGYGEHVVAVFIHDVVGIDERTRSDWAREGVYAVDTYDEAARLAHDLGLISAEGLAGVERAVAQGPAPTARR